MGLFIGKNRSFHQREYRKKAVLVYVTFIVDPSILKQNPSFSRPIKKGLAFGETPPFE